MLVSGEKLLMSAELKGCVTWFIHFLNLLYVRYNCAKFDHCRLYMTDCREEGWVWPPIREQPQKSSSWIKLSKFERINPFQSNVRFIYPLTTFSDVFTGYRNVTLDQNGSRNFYFNWNHQNAKALKLINLIKFT